MDNRKINKVMDGTKHSDINPDVLKDGVWREHIADQRELSEREADVNKHTTVPLAIQDKIVEAVVDGALPMAVAAQYEVTRGYVRSVLIRKFGSVEGMKRALSSQSFENAMALQEYGMTRMNEMAPEKAFLSAKLLVDAGLALDKSTQEKPMAYDFATLQKLGETLDKIEKRVEGKVVN